MKCRQTGFENQRSCAAAAAGGLRAADEFAPLCRCELRAAAVPCRCSSVCVQAAFTFACIPTASLPHCHIPSVIKAVATGTKESRGAFFTWPARGGRGRAASSAYANVPASKEAACVISTACYICSSSAAGAAPARRARARPAAAARPATTARQETCSAAWRGAARAPLNSVCSVRRAAPHASPTRYETTVSTLWT